MRVTTRPEGRVNNPAANSIRDVPTGCAQQGSQVDEHYTIVESYLQEKDFTSTFSHIPYSKEKV